MLNHLNKTFSGCKCLFERLMHGGDAASCQITLTTYYYYSLQYISSQHTENLQAVSTSMPENPNALSPWTQTTRVSGLWSRHQAAAAIAEPQPTPIVPNDPASRLHAQQMLSSTHFSVSSVQILAFFQYKSPYQTTRYY